MRILITTHVREDFRDVFARFDRSLFKALAPPFPPIKLMRFDGSRKGDEVHINMYMPGEAPHWISLITEDGEDQDQCWFVDEGKRLPFFIKSWRHRHIIRRAQAADENARGTLIIDDIEYQGRPGPLGYLLYPALYLQFLYRKPVYRRLFGTPDPTPGPS